MRICVYPGSFDPFTLGHLDVLKKAITLFDKVYVSVLNNSAKNPVFTVEERVRMIEQIVESEGLENVKPSSFGGLLVDYVDRVGAGYIIRGLRAITDFEYEFQIDAMNSRMNPSVNTVYFMAKPEHSFLSSSMIREIASFNADLKGLVPDCTIDFVAERLRKK
ncbi:MAG: pantetheine-phosphate adenylyltransferase [Clostridia bacterium]|nr:pantetheine-phosphate adenylyltransferase [Clostridia bacterium]